jgi:hypothetical protein
MPLNRIPEDPTDEQEVEIEDVGESSISRPYDPEKIRVDHQLVNLGTILEMLEGFLWNARQQSQLIESILLGLPLPSFYFSVDKTTNKWQVVDGLQRLSTLKAFWVNKTLRLQGLEFLESYMDKGFDDLSRADYRKISGFKINQYVIDKETPKEVKFLIFKRVNTGGLILTPQEMRHALNQGEPANLIKELSQYTAFKQATNYRLSDRRQEDRDFVNRFVAFYLLGYEENYEGELDGFLNTGMARIDQLRAQEISDLKRDFELSMETCFEIFGTDCFRKRNHLNDNRKPISKAVFDTISVNIAHLSGEDMDTLIQKGEDFKEGFMNLCNESVFNSAISTSTGQKQKVRYRFEKIKELIQNIVND